MHDLEVCRACGDVHVHGRHGDSDVALCRACGIAVVGVRGRFDLLFCPTCADAVREHNAHCATRIPLGRHTFVNGIALDREALARPNAIEDFVEAVHALAAGLDVVEAYARDLVRDNLGPADALPLDRYLEVARPGAVRELAARLEAHDAV